MLASKEKHFEQCVKCRQHKENSEKKEENQKKNQVSLEQVLASKENILYNVRETVYSPLVRKGTFRKHFSCKAAGN